MPEVAAVDDFTFTGAAVKLIRALKAGEAIEPLTETHPGLSVDDAYRIQRRLIELHVQDGRRPVGRKIGLTSKAIQEQLGVSCPDYGVVLDAYVRPSGTTVSLSRERLIAPRIEAELAFVLDRPIRGPGVTLNHVREATRAVVPIFELIDSRVADWRIALEDTVADNASCYGVVTGTECCVSADFPLDTTSVTITRDGKSLLRGQSSAVMGNPAAAVAWLANQLACYDESLAADELILSGSFTAAEDLSPGRYRAVFSDPFSTVELIVSP